MTNYNNYGNTDDYRRQPISNDSTIGKRSLEYGNNYNVKMQQKGIINVGDIYIGRISRLENYGIFVDLPSNSSHNRRCQRALVHISQIELNRRTEDVFQSGYKLGDEVHVLVIEVQPRDGKIRASIAAVNQATGVIMDGYEYPAPRFSYDHYPERHRDEYGRTAGEKEFMDAMENGHGGRKGPRSGQNVREWLKERAEKRLRTDFGRSIWARSPSPAKKYDDVGAINKNKKRRSHSIDDTISSSSSSSSSESSSSESSSSSDISSKRYRRKRVQHRSRRRRGRSPRRSSRNHRKRRRSYSSSSTSSSSSSKSSRSSTSMSMKNSNDFEPKKSLSHDQSLSFQEDSKPLNSISQDNEETLDNEDLREAQDFKKAVQGDIHNQDSSDDDGPMPLVESKEVGAGVKGSKAYGKALLPGEGEALAQYVQQNLRIPRRGEIGFSTDEINNWEKSGYVMSGSRHARMNAVRIRKENQIYSAEEQRALALITMEEKQQKEAALVQDFRSILKEKQAKIKELKPSDVLEKE